MARSGLARRTSVAARLRAGRRSLLRAAIVVAGVVALAAVAAGAVGQASEQARHGPVLRFNMSATDVDFTDPSLAYGTISWQLEYATALKLYDFPDAPAPEGSTLVPSAAAGFPVVSPDGRTYTIRVKPARFSDGRLVTAANFAFAINRALSPVMRSPGATFISNIVGAQEVLDGKAATASGVRVDGDKLIIELTEPDGGLVGKLAMPFFQALPLDLPLDRQGVTAYASAGPYYFAAREVGRSITLRRNPFYTGSRPAYADEFDLTVNTNLDQSLLQVESGVVDYDLGGLPATAHADLGLRYGVNASNGRYHVNQLVETDYIALNTSRPPFSNVALRKAFNYAIDRPAMVALRGAYAATPTDQILPPGMPGFREAALYPLDGPDLATARSLAGDSCGTVKLWTTTSATGQNLAAEARHALEQIGCTVEIRLFQGSQIYTAAGQRGADFDAAVVGWNQDYPDPFDFLDLLLNGRNIHDLNNNNLAYFDDPAINARLDEAKLLVGADRFAAYGALDVDIMRDHAPWVPYDNRNERELTAERITGYVFQPANATADIGTFRVLPLGDTTPPALTLPDDMSADAGAAVRYTVGATDDTDPSPLVSCAPPSGSVFRVGLTTVSCRATDAAGNSASGSFTVTVTGTPPAADTTPPTLVLPDDIAVNATSPEGAEVTYTASATDDTDPSPVVSCAPPSGSVFAIGTTTVWCTATDASWNSATGSFVVTVRPRLVIIASLTANSMTVNGAAPGATVTFTIRSAGGDVLATGSKPADGVGNASFRRPQDFAIDLAPGLEVTASNGVVTKRLTIPPLSVGSIDVARDVVSGTGAPNATLIVDLLDSLSETRTVTADATGAWSLDASPFDVTYWTTVRATALDDDGDTTYVYRHAPVISVSLSGSYFSVNGFAAKTPLTFTIRDAGVVVATGHKTSDGNGAATFSYNSEVVVRLSPGMELTVTDGTSTKRMTLPLLAVDSVDTATNVVSGRAPAGALVHLTASAATYVNKTVTAGANGTWSVDFSPYDVTYSTWIYADVLDADADSTSLSRRAPTLSASLSSDWLSASSFAPSTSLAFVIRDAGGTAVATGHKTSDATGYVSFSRGTDFSVDLVAGMVVTVTDGTVSKQMALPALAISPVDSAAGRVTGTAPVGAQVQVYLSGSGWSASRAVTAAADGTWSATFETSQLASAIRVSASVEDAESNTTSVDRRLPTLTVWLSSGYFTADGFAADAPLTFTIRQSPGGSVIATGTKTSSSTGYAYFYRGSDFSVDLVPGLELTVSDGSLTERLVVGAIAIGAVDPVHDTVSGTAPAGSSVQVYLYSPYASRTVTVDAGGAWTADFSSVDVTYASSASAYLVDADGDITAFSKAAPTITIRSYIYAAGFAGKTAITFTIRESPGGRVLATGTRTSDLAGQVSFYPGTEFSVTLAPGMEITVSDGTAAKRITVAAVTIDPVDVARNVVSGTAAAGMQLRVSVSGASQYSTQTTTVAGNGTWSIDFSPFDVTRPMWVYVDATDDDGDVTSVTKPPVPPQTTIDSGPSDYAFTNDSTPTFSFSADEPAAFRCSIDWGVYTTCTSPYTVPALADGSHRFAVYGADESGYGGPPVYRSFTVDTRAPVATIGWAPGDRTNDATPTFSFWADETSSYECRLDGVFAPCTSPFTADALADGDHVFAVRATDRAGNVSSALSRWFHVDTTPPVTTIVSAPSDPTNDPTPTFAFRTDEPAGAECRVDDAPFTPCSSPYTAGTLADGRHAFEARATDLAGNVGSAVRVELVVDTVVPVTAITAGPSRPTNDETPTFAFGADEAATFECRIDATPFAPCTSPHTTPALAAGAHVFEARATDRAGNAGLAGRTFSVQSVPDHVILRFVTDAGLRVTWDGDLARDGDVCATAGSASQWGEVAGSGTFGVPSTAFVVDLHGIGVGRLLAGSLTATRNGVERIATGTLLAPFSFSADGRAVTVSPVRTTYFDGRNTVFGALTIEIQDGGYATG